MMGRLFEDLRDYYADFVDTVNPQNLIPYLTHLLTTGDLSVVEYEVKHNGGPQRGARKLVSVMDGKVKLHQLAKALEDAGYSELAERFFERVACNGAAISRPQPPPPATSTATSTPTGQQQQPVNVTAHIVDSTSPAQHNSEVCSDDLADDVVVEGAEDNVSLNGSQHLQAATESVRHVRSNGSETESVMPVHKTEACTALSPEPFADAIEHHE